MKKDKILVLVNFRQHVVVQIYFFVEKYLSWLTEKSLYLHELHKYSLFQTCNFFPITSTQSRLVEHENVSRFQSGRQGKLADYNAKILIARILIART